MFVQMRVTSMHEASASASSPIGVFDSGIGGLTVAREIMRVLPSEDLIYLGDTARVPYGSRGTETITRFACEMTEFLLARGVKALVVACNTISATCLPELQALAGAVPVVGVLSATAEAAAQATRSGVVGVIGTRATIGSGAYAQAVCGARDGVSVYGVPCPLFVPFVEEGVFDHPAAHLFAKDYLAPLKTSSIDTLILGCTHYPIMKATIGEVMGPGVTLIDSGPPVAALLSRLLAERGLLREGHLGTRQFFATDAADRATLLASRFFQNAFPWAFALARLSPVHMPL